MKFKILKGYFLAFLFSILTLYFAWSCLFSLSGLSQNILLAIILAIFYIYYSMIYLGNFLNNYIFNINNGNTTPLSELLINYKSKKISNKKIFKKIYSIAMAILLALSLRTFILEPFQIPSSSMVPTLLIGDHLFVSKFNYGIINPFSSIKSYFIKWSNPKRGDVIVFTAPNNVQSNAGKTWIKRVIAEPGQTIQIKDSVLYVNNKAYYNIKSKKIFKYMNYVSSKKKFWLRNESIEIIEKIDNIKHKILLNKINSRHIYENNWPIGAMNNHPGLTCGKKECKVDPNYIFVMGDNRGNSADSRFWGALPINMVKGRALFIWMSVNNSKKIINIGNFSLPKFRLKRLFLRII